MLHCEHDMHIIGKTESHGDTEGWPKINMDSMNHS